MLALAWPAPAEELLRRTAFAETGDRLRLETLKGDVTIRLQGLSAPPPGTKCTFRYQSRWNCGGGSRDALAGQIEREDVVCRLVGGDEDGAVLAECEIQTLNLNLWMLQTRRAILVTGWRGLIPAYDEAEMIARRAGQPYLSAGLHRDNLGWVLL